ncbi:hypothetical protein AWB69_06680 [Caballeronia udeis]|uniref:Uncharacterized protein n=1 Tax=Caballeronia udeis TaxID=1232866 RepID=A0A158IUE2_9BURK|nr:hypothetical protein AWB69_06680 [Caballeronia udeis]
MKLCEFDRHVFWQYRGSKQLLADGKTKRPILPSGI